MCRYRKEIITLTAILFCCSHIAYGNDLPVNHYKYIDLAEANVPASQCFGDIGGIQTLGTQAKEGVVVVYGIPFQVDPKWPKCVVTGLVATVDQKIGPYSIPDLLAPEVAQRLLADIKKIKPIRIEIKSSVNTVYILATGRNKDHDNSAHKLWHGYNDDAYLVTRIHYTDGVTEDVIPKLKPSNRHYAADWKSEIDADMAALTLEEEDGFKRLFVYAVEPGRTEPIESIEFIAEKPTFLFAVFAVTCDKSMAVSREPAIVRPEPVLIEDYKTEPRTLIFEKGELQGRSSLMDFTMDLSAGVSLSTLSSRHKLRNLITKSSTPLLKIKVGDIELSADDFQVTDVNFTKGSHKASILLEPRDINIPITLEVRLAIEDPGRLRMQLVVKGKGTCEVQPTFPIIDRIVLGEIADNDEYYFPIKGGVLNDRPINLNNLYSGFGAWIQFMDISDWKAGGGLTLRVEDNTNMAKRFELRKMEAHDPFVYNRFAGFSDYKLPFEADGDATAMAIHYQPWKIDAGEDLVFPETVLEVHQGDWRTAANLYMAWLKSWYVADKRAAWVKRIFIDRELFDSRYMDENNRYTTKNLLGFEDAIKLWMWWEEAPLRGDYNYRKAMGGSESLRRFVETLQARDLRVYCYIEGWWLGQETEIAKEKGDEWGLMHANGEYSSDFSKYNMCQAQEGWHDYITGVGQRIVADLDLDGLYIDCSARVYRDCYNPIHKHKTPGVFLAGAGELLKKAHQRMRDKHNPLTAVWSEEPGTDVTTQWLDMGLSYALWYYLGEMPRELAPQGMNFFRFLMPDFKLVEIVGNGNEEGSRLAFFNATGILGLFENPVMYPLFERLAYAFHQHEDAFTSNDVEPLVPTLREGLYANGFYAKKEKVYTLFNANYRTLSGVLLELPFIKGAVYTDIFSGREYDIKLKSQKVIVSGVMGPRDVTAVVVKLPY